MGGAVSSGRDNNELIDNLVGGGYIRTPPVERVFRVLDRADYMSAEERDQAYKDLAWRNGLLHLSAPCIYSEVMEALELKPGLSFLNLGSGTGYLSTLAGLILGPGGISHGIDCYPAVIEYANRKLGQFLEKSVTLDEFDFCFPKFYCGNALALAPLQATYDRVYCGAGVLGKFENHFKQLVKVGGVLVMPLRDTLVQVRRIAPDEWRTRKLLNVSFALLRVPADDDRAEPLKMDELTPPTLQVLARGAIRAAMRLALQRRQPELREPTGPRAAPDTRNYPRRVCIPLDADSDAGQYLAPARAPRPLNPEQQFFEGLNELHDLDPASGANEMNALLSLVLSMGQNRVAGSLRLDSMDDFDTSPASSDAGSDVEYNENDDDDDDDDDNDENGERAPSAPAPGAAPRAPGVASPPLASEPSSPERPPPELPPPGQPFSEMDHEVIRFEVVHDRRSRRRGPLNQGSERSYRALRPCLRPIRVRRIRPEPIDPPDDPVEAAPASDTAPAPAPPTAEVAPAEVVIGSHESDGDVDGDMDEEMPSSLDSSSSSEPEPETETRSRTRRHGSKRQKLDSGIGEGASSASGATPDKSSSESSRSEGSGRRGRGGGGGSGGRRLVRRLRLSAAMKAAVKELPLPLALQQYVNLGRCFDF